MLANFKTLECTLCGKAVVGIMHMGCDAVHCSERCAVEYLNKVRKKDPNMENPGSWPGGSAERMMKRKASLRKITEEAVVEADHETDLDEVETTGKQKHKEETKVKMTDAGKAAAGALLIVLIIACLGLI